MTLNLAIATGLLAVLAGSVLQNGRTTSTSDAETPFFCNLKALTPTERAEHREVTTRVLSAVTAIRELPTGYAFDVAPAARAAAVSITDLAKWVDFERRCCPFFDFQLSWARENGPVSLQLTGRDGVKEFIRAEFATLFRK